jgi:hypothetical protein
MGNHNKQINYLCSDLVTVNYTDRAGCRQRVTANLEEIAPNRLSLLVDLRIPTGSRATIEVRGLILRGRARKSEHSDDLGWFVEVRLAPDSQWSRDRYTPAHMLNPEPSFCRHSPTTKVNALESPSGY